MAMTSKYRDSFTSQEASEFLGVLGVKPAAARKRLTNLVREGVIKRSDKRGCYVGDILMLLTKDEVERTVGGPTPSQRSLIAESEALRKELAKAQMYTEQLSEHFTMVHRPAPIPTPDYDRGEGSFKYVAINQFGDWH